MDGFYGNIRVIRFSIQVFCREFRKNLKFFIEQEKSVFLMLNLKSHRISV